jgi:hypothetical protein
MDNGSVQTKMPSKKKNIQVPVILGFGEKQELVVNLATVSPPSPPVFRIKDIDKFVEIFDWKVVPIQHKKEEIWKVKVIIDGFIDKNINYKTIEDWDDKAVNGPLFHFTTKVFFNTFIEVKLDEPANEYDVFNVEFLEKFVEGEKDELLCPNPKQDDAPEWAVTYNQILEKMIVKIRLKVTKTEEICITADQYYYDK